MPKFDFEPVIELPGDTVHAGLIFCGVLAYPGRGEGLPGGAGSRFVEALVAFRQRAYSRQVGLGAVRAELGDRTFRPPELDSFKGVLRRGLRRVHQRARVAQLHELRVFSALQGKPLTDVMDLTDGVLPPYGQLLASRLDVWRKRLALNAQDLASVVEEARGQALKDLRTNALRPSVSVLHLAYGLVWSAGPVKNLDVSIGAEALIAEMVLRPELWAARAIEIAIEFRGSAPLVGRPDPSSMIELRWKSPAIFPA